MCLLYRTLPNPANTFMIILSFLCSFYVPFDNFVFSHKQNLCFLWLCKLKSGILHSRILVYDYFELFILFLSFIYTECAGKTGPPYCIFFIPAPTPPPSGHTPPKGTAPAPACAFSPPSSQPAARSRPRLRPPSQRQNTRRSSAVRSTGKTAGSAADNGDFLSVSGFLFGYGTYGGSDVCRFRIIFCHERDFGFQHSA